VAGHALPREKKYPPLHLQVVKWEKPRAETREGRGRTCSKRPSRRCCLRCVATCSAEAVISMWQRQPTRAGPWGRTPTPKVMVVSLESCLFPLDRLCDLTVKKILLSSTFSDH
jgi:hypothetical protein